MYRPGAPLPWYALMSKQIPVQDVTPPAKGDTNNNDLYAKREKIYTRAFTGIFRRLRMVGGAALFLLYFGTVWLNWSGRQAVWWDLPERKFYIFGATFWPQDFMLLSWLLIVCAFGLFFITVFAGRVWCGYTCPQSVWTWIYMWCEKVTEGDRNQRIKLDKAPMSGNKLLRKTAKHSLWLLDRPGHRPDLRRLLLADPRADSRAAHRPGRRLGLLLGRLLHPGHLRQRRLAARAGVHLHVPLRALPERDVRQGHLIVSYDPRRGEARPAQEVPSTTRPRAWATASTARCACRSARPASTSATACRSVHRLRGVHRRLRQHHGEDELPERADQLHHRAQPQRPEDPPGPARLIGYAIALVLMISALITAVVLRPLVGFDVSKDRVLYRENETRPHRERVQPEDHEQGSAGPPTSSAPRASKA